MKPITALLILDGFGYRKEKEGNAIKTDGVANIKALWDSYPHTLLQASGMDVVLPAGQMGNSEVGHLNIGAGRIVYQDLVKINRACADGSILKNPEIVSAYEYAKQNGKSVHLMGLTSTGGVWGSALCRCQ